MPARIPLPQPLTDPGRHRAAIEALGGNVADLVAVVQGLTIHADQLDLYGLELRDFDEVSRRTLSVETRLDRVLALNAAPLSEPRPFAERVPGTCRDYALLLTAFLRVNGFEARVRCGFAAYFTAGTWEDHWVCEYRPAGGRAWRLADAQIDQVHKGHYDIRFAAEDVPRTQYLTASQAWPRANAAVPFAFGHGEARGTWFVVVNLARDLGALLGQEMSAWDGWRDLDPARDVPHDLKALGDRLARHVGTVADADHPSRHADLLEGAFMTPFWLDTMR